MPLPPPARPPRVPNTRTQKYQVKKGRRPTKSILEGANAEACGSPFEGADHTAAAANGVTRDGGRTDSDVLEEHVKSLSILDACGASDPADHAHSSLRNVSNWQQYKARSYRPQELQALLESTQEFHCDDQQAMLRLPCSQPQYAAGQMQTGESFQQPEQFHQRTDQKSQAPSNAPDSSRLAPVATSLSAPPSSVNTTQNSPDPRPRSKTVHVVDRPAVTFSPPPGESEPLVLPTTHVGLTQQFSERPTPDFSDSSSTQTNGTNLYSKSLPVSRRNSGDLSGIWKGIEKLGLGDDIGPANIFDGPHHTSRKYRSLTDAEGGFLPTGMYTDTIPTSARLGRTFTMDGSISAYTQDPYGQHRHSNAAEPHSREEPGPNGSPQLSSEDNIVKGYYRMNDPNDTFPILVRHESHPGMVSASSAPEERSSLSHVPSRQSTERSIQEWLPEDVAPREVPVGEDTQARQSGSRHRPVHFGPDSLNCAYQPPCHYVLGGRPSNVTTEGYGLMSRQHHGGRVHHPGQGVFDGVAATVYEENSMLVAGQSKHGGGVCKYFQHGSCSRGSRCSFSHVFQGAQAPLHRRAKDQSYHQYYNLHQSQLYYQPPHRQHHAHHQLHQGHQHHHSAQRHSHTGIGAVGDRTVSAYLGGGPHGTTLYMGGAPPASPYLGSVRPPPGIAPPECYHLDTYQPPGTYGGGRYTQPNHHHLLPLAYASAQSAYANGLDHAGGESRSSAAPVKNGSRRSIEMDDKTADRFAGVRPEDLVGEIYNLSKDQNGCRHLQKMLEERNEQYLDMIFDEVIGYFSELMTDPFGNYLCQKLLEHCTDEQRTMISESVAPDLLRISLNMHGTRAVQKLIDYISNPIQVRSLTVAFAPNVVILIKDLNGNHVVQKCLYKLSPENNQFIYDAVSQHCIEVATHRHGCCVLQRCIDHASDAQKVQLVTEITYNALTLVQDPFGNYVVQYVLDLGDARFSETIVRRFIGNVSLLSVQKFSSNVMEKCIRVADSETRWRLIDEMLNQERLDKLLRDSYGNYVVQTALDYADPLQRAKLVESILPLLPAIRNTPYGKRIQCKLQCEIHGPPLTSPGVLESGIAGGSVNAGIGISGGVHELNVAAAAAATAAGFTHFAPGPNSSGLGHSDFKVYPYM